MAKDLALALKIQALVKGLEEVAALTTELEDLAAAGSEPIPDNTAELRAGAGEASGALRETADATADVGDAASESAPQMSELSASITKAVAAGAGLAALAASLKSFADEAMEADTRGRKLEGVVRATGGAAGFTADQIREMSAELALATLGSIRGFEDAAAALMTFKNVSGDTFSQALELSQDLASVMGGDAKSAALQLGKALEDPTRGITALTRAGVTFSETEQEIIKSLVESGKLFEAQGLILEKVSGQVGGVAREMAGGLAGALDTVGQRAEELRVKLGDAMQPGMITIANQISGALEVLADNLDGVATAATAVGATAVAALAIKGAAAAKAYAASISIATVATTALTKATLGLAAAGQAAVGSGLLLAKAWPVALFAGVAYAALELSGALDELRQDAERLEEAKASLADTQERVEARLRAISAATGVAVKSLDEFNRAVAEGKIAWDASLATWVRVRSEMELLAANSPKPVLEAVRQELELLAQRGPETAAALERIMLAADVGSANGIRELSADMDYLRAAALATGAQIDTALRQRLARLTATELKAFRVEAELAFAGTADAAERLAAVNDAILNASFTRLGINAAAALGKISPAAEDAIAAVDGIVTALDDARVESERSALVIEQALTKAFDVADSLPALDALEARLKKLAAEGKLSAQGVARLGEEVQKARARIEQATPGVTRVTQALERNAAEAEAAAKKMAELREEYERLMQAGDMQGAAAVQQQMSELRQETEKTNETLKDTGDSGNDAKDGLENAAEGAKKAAEGADEAEQATEKLGKSINDTTMIARLYAAQIKQLKADIAGYSGAALRAVEAAYDSAAGFSDAARRIQSLTANAQELIAEDAMGGVDQVFAEAKDEAAALRAELEEMQSFERIFGAGLAFAGLRRYIASLQEMKVALAEAKARLAELDVEVAAFDETVAAGTLSLSEQERELARLVARAEELGSQQLTGLRAALDDVRRKMQDVAESARDTLGQLQDELDEIEGRYVAIERRRIAARRADIQAQLAEARASGDQEAVKLLTEALRALEQIEKARLDEAKARERETRERRREETSGAARPGGGEPGPGGRGTTSVTSHMPIHIHGITDPVKLAPMLEAELRKLAKLRN